METDNMLPSMPPLPTTETIPHMPPGTPAVPEPKKEGRDYLSTIVVGGTCIIVRQSGFIYKVWPSHPILAIMLIAVAVSLAFSGIRMLVNRVAKG
jgi:hypothetical protein